jgi:hypothetical protein
MPLNKLDNFIKNTEGRILYVNPNDLDSTDSIENQGNSLTRPFKTIQRALLEAARFSYIAGNNNDLVEKTTILLFPGEHLIDNRPGWAIYNNNGAKAVSRSGAESVASSVFSLGLDSIFDLNQEDNILYKFNSFYGGVVVPRGTSIVGLDLRKTKVRAKYVPNPTDSSVPKSSIFKITGACYFWQFSLFDADPSGLVYTNPDNFTSTYQSSPNFSHHKLTCFEFCDGVNNIGSYGLTDLDMYYSKVSNAYNSFRAIDDNDKYPENPNGFAKRNPEWEIVGAFATDPIEISSIFAGTGSVATSTVTVITKTPHGLNAGTPIKIKGVTGSGLTSPYNVSTTVQNILNSTSFTYLLPAIESYPTINPSPSASSSTVTIETDTVSGASPYIFNCSLRSVWGMNGLHADGSKASGFRSTVVAQFTAVSLQKDDRAFAKYDKSSRTYQSVSPITTVYGSSLPDGASQTDSNKVYHLDPDAVYRQGWESSHIKITNDAFIQIVSVFAIGFNKHFDAETGGDASITNSNSNFGQISLNSSGFKKEAFDKDDKAFITSIIPPRAIDETEDVIEWLSIDVGLTTTSRGSTGISSHLYLYGFTSKDAPPSTLTQGYRIGARLNDKLYVNLGGSIKEASIFMCNNQISSTGLTTALGTTSSVKLYDVISGPTGNSFTIGSNNLLTGEKVKIISDDGDLPENIEEHATYYVIKDGSTAIKLASSFTNATQSEEITVYGGSNLHILSRVSDKDSGDLGSPIQFDAQNNNWFIHVNANNEIYNTLSIGGTSLYGETTDLSYVNRISDERSLDEKIYKVRVVIPKELPNAKDPESGFIIQESSTTGARDSFDFTRSSIGSTDYGYNRNPRFISTCTVSSGTVTVFTDLPHNLQVGELVNIRNVSCTNNLNGVYNIGYNGRFAVRNITDANTFTYSTTDTEGNLHNPGIFANDVSIRNENLPRFERNDWRGNLFVYRNEVISPYIFNQQDGIYHLYVLNSNNKIAQEFTNLEFGQLPSDLYPQLDRDNIDPNPNSAKTFAKRSPIGAIVTNDLKKSITRESADLLLKEVGLGITLSSVSSSSISATLTFPRFHGFSGIVTGSITSGANYIPLSGIATYHNVKLLNGSQTGSWNGATARVVVSGGAVVSVNIISPGSGYSAGALYFDQSRIGTGNGNARYTITSSTISSNVDDVIQVTGYGTTADQYYRITSVPSSTTISIAKTSGDPVILSSQYVFLVGPSVRISASTPSYNSTTKISTFTTTSAHGLLVGNRFQVNDSSNNNLGNYIVERRISPTQFTAITNSQLSAANGYILKHALSSNEASSDERGENFGVRHITFYDSERFTLTSALTTGTTINFSSSGSGTARRLPLGSYIQIDSEIMRVVSSNNSTSATVIRGALGTNQESHDANSLIRKINPIAIEFRRPSILRASGHTFEYLGYGPGNYSTGLPQVQVKTLNDQENFLANSQERSCGVVVYTGMNNNGDFYSGNTKTSSTSGEVVSYDIPKPTVTGEDPNRLSVVFDEVTVKERLLVEGGVSGQVLSQFDGPVTFNKEIRVKAQSRFNSTVRLTQGNQSTSTTTGNLIVAGGVGIGGNLNVGGNANFTGDSVFDGNQTVDGNLTVRGNTSLGNESTDTTIIRGSLTANNNLTVNGNTTLGDGLSDTTNITGSLNANSNVYVAGITTLGDSSSDTTNITGSLIVTNNLNVSGVTTLGNALTDSTIINGTLSVTSNLSVNGNTTLGNASTDTTTVNGNLYVTQDIYAFYTASDKNWKDNVVPIQNALDKVISISGNTFDWNEKAPQSGKDVGVIAQEIQKILPEAVSEREDGHLSVSYQKLVPLLVEAIKELKQEIDDLKKSK